MSAKTCMVCGEVTWIHRDSCFYCQTPFGRRIEQSNTHTAISLTNDQAALLEEVITRQFDENGTPRNEVIERRSWVVPAQAVPAAALRALSSQSFVPYAQPALPQIELKASQIAPFSLDMDSLRQRLVEEFSGNERT